MDFLRVEEIDFKVNLSIADILKIVDEYGQHIELNVRILTQLVQEIFFLHFDRPFWPEARLRR